MLWTTPNESAETNSIRKSAKRRCDGEAFGHWMTEEAGGGRWRRSVSGSGHVGRDHADPGTPRGHFLCHMWPWSFLLFSDNGEMVPWADYIFLYDTRVHQPPEMNVCPAKFLTGNTLGNTWIYLVCLSLGNKELHAWLEDSGLKGIRSLLRFANRDTKAAMNEAADIHKKVWTVTWVWY